MSANVTTIFNLLTIAQADITALKAADTELESKLASFEKEWSDFTDELDNTIKASIEKNVALINGWVSTVLTTSYWKASEVQAAINNLIEQIDNGLTPTVEAQQTALDQLVAEELARATDLAKQTDALETASAGAENLKAALETLSASIDANMANLKAAYEAAISAAVASLQEGYLSYYGTEIADVTVKIENWEALAAQIQQNTADIAILQERTTALESTYAGLTDDITTLRFDVNQLIKEIDDIAHRIQSLTYIPTHVDGYARVPLQNGKIQDITLDFKVTPATAFDDVENPADIKNHIVAEATPVTKGATTFLEIADASVEDGVLSVTLATSKETETLGTMFTEGKVGLAVRINVKKGVTDYSSEFITMVKQGFNPYGLTFGAYPDFIRVEPLNTSAEFKILADNELTWEIKDVKAGATISVIKGAGNADVKITFPKNDDETLKDYSVTLECTNSDKVAPVEVHIYQAGKNNPTDGLVGRFTVSDTGKRVYFSKGNLYYNTQNSSWYMESNQQDWTYDIDGAILGTPVWSSTHSSHFFWSSDGSNAGGKQYDATSESLQDVLFANASLGLQATPSTGWRVLSSDEWDYLLNKRVVNGGKGKGYSWDEKTVSDISGILIYYDGYDKTQSETGIPEGCAFLPSAGYRDYESITLPIVEIVIYDGSVIKDYSLTGIGDRAAYYWTSDHDETDKSKAICFYYSQNTGTFVQRTESRSHGCCVRLVMDAVE